MCSSIKTCFAVDALVSLLSQCVTDHFLECNITNICNGVGLNWAERAIGVIAPSLLLRKLATHLSVTF